MKLCLQFEILVLTTLRLFFVNRMKMNISNNGTFDVLYNVNIFFMIYS